MKARASVIRGAALVVAAALAPEVLAQCAMCKTALTNSPEGQQIANNFNHAILVMLVAPYIVFGVFITTIFRDRIRRWLRQHVPVLARSAPRSAIRLAP